MRAEFKGEAHRRMRSPVPLAFILLAAVTFAAVAGARGAKQVAARVKEKGPAVGSRVPPFKAPDQFGNEQTPASLVGERGAVILFFRSADWCLYCKEQLVQLQRARARFRQRGFKLAAVSYDDAEVLKAFARDQRIEYSLIADPRSEIIRSFGLLDAGGGVSDKHPSARAGFALPGFLVIDRRGVVTEKFFGDYFYDRYTPNNVIGKLFPELIESAARPLSAPHLQLVAKQSDREVTYGNRITLAAEITLPPDTHVYAPGQKRYTPIQLKIDSVGGAPLDSRYVGVLSYPKPKVIRLPASGGRVSVYEGRFSVGRDVVIVTPESLKLILDDPSAADVSVDLKVQGRLTYQACDAETCYPPEDVPVTWDLKLHSPYRHSAPEGASKKRD